MLIEDGSYLAEKIIDQCFHIPFNQLKNYFDKAYDQRRKNFPDKIHFYIPSMVQYNTQTYKSKSCQNFPAISVTGKSCQLNCEHCKKSLLESMIPATNPEELFVQCQKIKQAGGQGCLISGGSQKEGSVPLAEFAPSIKRVKKELGLKVVVHTGLISPTLAKKLGEAQIDAAMLDILGSEETINDVYHLNCNVESFRQSLFALQQNHIPTVPHIVVGIHYGKLKGEETAVKLIAETNPTAIVIVALKPLKNTSMEKVKPPSPSDISRVILSCRLLMPNKPILLGCARPGGTHRIRTDALAIKAGVNGIAYPSEEALKTATKAGLKTVFREECCSLIWQDIDFLKNTQDKSEEL